MTGAMQDPPVSAYAAWPALDAARRHSLATLARLEAAVAATLAGGAEFTCVAAAGSLARLEAGPQSDLDAIAVTDGPPAAARATLDRVYATLDGLPLRAPKASGIYRDAVDVQALLAPAARGALDEPPALFGKRFQFLLDTRALHGHAAHARLQRAVLDWYVAGDVDGGAFASLLHDLQRYRHAYASWQRHKFDRDAEDGWYLRQAKLGSTRLLGFVGLLVLVGASTAQERPVDWLAAQLARTPFERLRLVMADQAPACFAELAQRYDAVTALLHAPSVREELVALSPTCAAALPPSPPASYAAIHAHNLEIRRLIARFMLIRAGDWPIDFHAQLMA